MNHFQFVEACHLLLRKWPLEGGTPKITAFSMICGNSGGKFAMGNRALTSDISLIFEKKKKMGAKDLIFKKKCKNNLFITLHKFFMLFYNFNNRLYDINLIFLINSEFLKIACLSPVLICSTLTSSLVLASLFYYTM